VSARATLLLALLALAACRATPLAPDLRPPSAEWPALAALDTWHARGRVAVRSAADGFSASFDWHEAGGRSEIDVRGPLGAGAAHITRSADLIRIDTGAQPPIEVPAPFDRLEDALTQRLGFPLPIEPLRYWILGAPASDRPSAPAPAGFAQDGWTVALDDFTRVPAAPAPLPARLTLSREGTRIKVAVTDWTVGGS